MCAGMRQRRVADCVTVCRYVYFFIFSALIRHHHQRCWWCWCRPQQARSTVQTNQQHRDQKRLTEHVCGQTQMGIRAQLFQNQEQRGPLLRYHSIAINAVLLAF